VTYIWSLSLHRRRDRLKLSCEHNAPYNHLKEDEERRARMADGCNQLLSKTSTDTSNTLGVSAAADKKGKAPLASTDDLRGLEEDLSIIGHVKFDEQNQLALRTLDSQREQHQDEFEDKSAFGELHETVDKEARAEGGGEARGGGSKGNAKKYMKHCDTSDETIEVI
jgi:hypothetical protein